MKNFSLKMAVVPLLAIFIAGYMPMVAHAADSAAFLNSGTGIGGLFDRDLSKIAQAFLFIAKITVTIMTCTALILVMWGIEDGKKTVWNWILGAGLAINFAAFLSDVGLIDYVEGVKHQSAGFSYYTPDLKEAKDGGIDIFSTFMNTYRKGIIEPGAAVIMPICMKILLILTVIQASWDLAFKLVSGDKIKYLLTLTIKVGFMVFLLENWIETPGGSGLALMTALSDGFQTMGYMMGGAGNKAIIDGTQPDAIVNNAIVLFTIYWEDVSILTSPGVLFIKVIGCITLVILLFLTGIEMFMARVEFYTMALLVMPLLPFIITSKFSFLSDKAIGAMFNLAIKCSAVAFITTMAVPFLNSFVSKVKDSSSNTESLGIMLQSILAALFLYLLTKKISNLVSGLLNGQPSLGGNMMTDQLRTATRAATGTAQTVATGVGAARGAAAVARSLYPNGSKGQMAMGTAGHLAKMALANKVPFASNIIQGQRRGIQSAHTEQNVKVEDQLERMRKRTAPIIKNNPFGNKNK